MRRNFLLGVTIAAITTIVYDWSQTRTVLVVGGVGLVALVALASEELYRRRRLGQ
jgi:hypothetical protein